MNCYLKKPWEGLQVLTAVCWYQFYNLCLERGRGNEQRLRFGTSFELDCVDRRTFCGQKSPGELFITVECKEFSLIAYRSSEKPHYVSVKERVLETCCHKGQSDRLQTIKCVEYAFIQATMLAQPPWISCISPPKLEYLDFYHLAKLDGWMDRSH